MQSNPRIPSRLGCGGLLLLLLGMIAVPLVGGGLVDLGEGALFVADEPYRIGEIWWLVGPLGVLSIIAVFRLAFGRRDWLAAAVAAVWTVIAAGYALGTAQYSFLVLTGLILFLIATGTWKDRREIEANGG